ncbi:MAG: recombination regulator RecX [Acetatifactor sp.]|nr:recombination regulator RecX [Acetatifactor sp.]
MRVTQIVELSKSRSKVYIEQEFAFVLYKGELRMYHIHEGEEIKEEDYQTIMQELLPKRAKLRAMNLLTKRDYTTAQLKQKLMDGFYPKEIIEQALDYVASFHYTDDLRYATDYIDYHESDKSRRRIVMDLTSKGISEEIIERAFEEWEEQGGCRNEIEMIERLLEKKHYDGEQADFKETQRVFAWLMRKGFECETIKKVMHNFR